MEECEGITGVGDVTCAGEEGDGYIQGIRSGRGWSGEGRGVGSRSQVLILKASGQSGSRAAALRPFSWDQTLS